MLASGAGTTFAALTDGLQHENVAAEVVLLIVSRAGVGAAGLAAARDIECVVLDERILGSQRCDEEMLALLHARRIDLVVLAGYLRKIGPQTLQRFSGRIVDPHPASLPRFGGKGMYGEHVHRAVLNSGVAASAATVHLVEAEYDTGRVIAQRPVPVVTGDDVSSLRAPVQQAERKLLIQTLPQLAAELPRSTPAAPHDGPPASPPVQPREFWSVAAAALSPRRLLLPAAGLKQIPVDAPGAGWHDL